MKWFSNLWLEIKKIRWSNNKKTLLMVFSTLVMIVFIVALITGFTYFVNLIFDLF